MSICIFIIFLSIAFGLFIFKSIIDEFEYSKSYRRYTKISNMVSKMILSDIDKYKNESLLYLNIISSDCDLLSTSSISIYYNFKSDQLIKHFKNIIPEILEEEREEKIIKILK